ncbi:hypothetical protein [Halobaculum sp. MBLA0143]|uniref:hypothetical protein n=1 Tax=Halobaculum sp. MBLA0143 TaxID=3079933 RepID=UPI0035264E99
MTVPEWRRKLAIVALTTGLLSLRAALTHPPGPVLQAGCQGWHYNPVTWRADLTLDFYDQECYGYADGALVVFSLVTACGVVLTAYGAVTLFRHGLDGSQ